MTARSWTGIPSVVDPRVPRLGARGAGRATRPIAGGPPRRYVPDILDRSEPDGSEAPEPGQSDGAGVVVVPL